MAFNSLAAKVIASIRPLLGEAPTIIELGNQRLMVDAATIEQIIQSSSPTGMGSSLDIQALRRMAALSFQARLSETANFYKALGFESYTAVDINSNFGSLVMDLNLDLREYYRFSNRYDLVTNIGTGEHLFNQYQVFKNIHDLAKPGGLMAHVMPFVNWLNHGFFNYQPVLYNDLAAANGYSVVSMSFCNRLGAEVKVDLSAPRSKATRSETSAPRIGQRTLRKLLNRGKSLAFQFVARRPTTLTLEDSLEEGGAHSPDVPLSAALQHIKLRGTRDILIATVLRKNRDTDFIAPIQGKYADAAETVEIRQRYEARSA